MRRFASSAVIRLRFMDGSSPRGKLLASELLCKATSMALKPRRLVLLMPKTTYRADDFVEAAAKLGVEVVYATDRCHVLAELGTATMPGDSLVLDFEDPAASAAAIVAYAKEKPVGAIVAV